MKWRIRQEQCAPESYIASVERRVAFIWQVEKSFINRSLAEARHKAEQWLYDQTVYPVPMGMTYYDKYAQPRDYER